MDFTKITPVIWRSLNLQRLNKVVEYRGPDPGHVPSSLLIGELVERSSTAKGSRQHLP